MGVFAYTVTWHILIAGDKHIGVHHLATTFEGLSGSALSCATQGWECRPPLVLHRTGLPLKLCSLGGWSSRIVTCDTGRVASHRRMASARGKVACLYDKELSQGDPWPWPIPLCLVSPCSWQCLICNQVALVYPNLVSVSFFQLGRGAVMGCRLQQMKETRKSHFHAWKFFDTQKLWMGSL